MSNPGQFDFCPKCGAVARDGICQSCGYVIAGVKIDKPKNENDTLTGPVTADNNLIKSFEAVPVETFFTKATNDPEPAKTVDNNNEPVKKKKKQKAFPIILIISGIIVLLIMALALWGLFEESIDIFDESTKAETEYDYYSHIYEDYNYDGTMEDYLSEWFDVMVFNDKNVAEPFIYDEYEEDYYVFSDYVVDGVDYQVMQDTWSYYNADGWHDYDGVTYPHNLGIYCDFVTLENTGLENEDELNDLICSITTKAGELYEYDKSYLEDNQYYDISEYVYVTYMDEEKISLLFINEGFMLEDFEELEGDEYEDAKNIWSSSIYSLNINLTDGSVMDASEIFDINEELVDEYFEIVNRDFPKTYLNNYTKEEVLKDFRNGGLIWFYTPVGVEFGYYYGPDYGYSTATFNDYHKYLK